MRIRHFASTCNVSAALVMAALATPAMTQENAGADYASSPPAPEWSDNRHAPRQPYMDPRARDAWLANCRKRLSDHEGDASGTVINGRMRDECEVYLDDYYAWYMQRGYGYNWGCCQSQPMRLAPVARTSRSKPKCTETVEYEYEDVPVHRAAPPPRPAPQKRVKIVPDKRIKQ